MHIERVRFDQVFDVGARARTFSFTSAGKTRYGVRLPGRIVPHEGAVYAVALARQDDWSTVLGWRELGTRHVILKTVTWPAWPVMWGVGEAACWLLGAGVVVAARGAGPWALLLAAGVIGTLVVHLRRRGRRVRQALLAAA